MNECILYQAIKFLQEFEISSLLKRMIRLSTDHFVLRERSLFMAGTETEEKVPCTLKNILPHHLLK